MLFLFCVMAVSSASHTQGEFSVLEGPFLGQKPPDSTPEPFAPGIVTTKDWEVGGVFSPDMNEFYFLKKRLDNKK